MILGTPQSARSPRTPFTRPEAASGAYVPQLPFTGFFSHFHPLTQVTHAMRSASMYRPPLVPSMGPHGLPPVPAAAPVTPASVAPTVPTPGGTAGFGGSFGSTGGTQAGHSHVDPYMVMRQGVIPGVFPSGANIRAGVTNAGARIHRSMPFQTAPLPPPPPPPAPVATVPAVPATGVKGLMGVLSDHLGFPQRRRIGSGFWFSRMMSRPRLATAPACERIGPRSDGLFVTICNGTVTEYSDAAGNVRANPYA